MALTLRRNKSTRLTKDELDDNFVHVSNYENLTNKPTLLKGDTGDQGLPGAKGDTGDQGLPGAKGDTGDQGLPGAKGDTGDQGLPGAKGDTGDQGLPGAKGDTGDQGLPGAKGDTGETGAASTVAGPKGDTGTKGDTGDTGAKGDTGDDGADALWNWQSEYSAGPQYQEGDIVAYQGSTYRRNNYSNSAMGFIPTNGTYWEPVSEKGDTGETGAAGETPTLIKSSSNLFDWQGYASTPIWTVTLSNTANRITMKNTSVSGTTGSDNYFIYTLDGTTPTTSNGVQVYVPYGGEATPYIEVTSGATLKIRDFDFNASADSSHYNRTLLVQEFNLPYTGFSGSYNDLTNKPTVNYIQTIGNPVSVPASATLPYTIISGTITTTGNPVRIHVCGDLYQASGGLPRIQIFRDTSGLGRRMTVRNAGVAGTPFAIEVVDPVPAGTYTYSLKVVSDLANGVYFGQEDGNMLNIVELK